MRLDIIYLFFCQIGHLVSLSCQIGHLVSLSCQIGHLVSLSCQIGHLVSLSCSIMSGGAESGFRHVTPEEYRPRLLRFYKKAGRGSKVVLWEVGHPLGTGALVQRYFRHSPGTLMTITKL